MTPQVVECFLCGSNANVRVRAWVPGPGVEEYQEQFFGPYETLPDGVRDVVYFCRLHLVVLVPLEWGHTL